MQKIVQIIMDRLKMSKLLCILATVVILGENVTGVPLADVKTSDHPIILVISYDGFRADYFDRVDMPALNALKRNSVRVPYMEPVFPTKTFPNHQSVATGMYSETHGIVDNVVFDPLFNKTLSGFNDDPGFWNYHQDVMPIWIYNEMAGEGRISGCLNWPGSSMPYGEKNDTLPTYKYPTYNGSVPWEERVDTVISWITNASNPANLVFLYYEEPDTHGHGFGPNAPETIEEISLSDNRTDYLVKKLQEIGIFDKINLIMLSDHGMKEVTRTRIINITSLIDEHPDLIERTHGGTPVLHVQAKEGKSEQLYEVLSRHSQRYNFTVSKKDELRDPHYYTETRRVLDYVLIAEPGYAFDDFYRTIDSHNSRWNRTGDDFTEYGVHGYTNVDSSMRPFFLAHGPAFKRDFDHGAIKNVDIVPLISAILGIQEPPNNGSLTNVINMLEKEPPNNGSLTNVINMLEKEPQLHTNTSGSESLIYSSSTLIYVSLLLRYVIELINY